jgi:hypothetical protein
MRRVLALAEVDGQLREIEFLTNNLCWSAGGVADLYRCRWQVEVFFKQIKAGAIPLRGSSPCYEPRSGERLICATPLTRIEPPALR